MNSTEIYMAIIVMSLANLLTRVFPFIFFSKKNPPEYIEFIAKNFPPIIMTILIFYTLGKIDFTIAPYGFKEIISVVMTGVFHLVFKNYLISIFMGTAFYMILVQAIV